MAEGDVKPNPNSPARNEIHGNQISCLIDSVHTSVTMGLTVENWGKNGPIRCSSTNRSDTAVTLSFSPELRKVAKVVMYGKRFYNNVLLTFLFAAERLHATHGCGEESWSRPS